MSVMDEVTRLRALAAEVPSADLIAAKARVVDVNTRAAEIIGGKVGFYHGIGSTAAGLMEQVQAAVARCEEFESAINDAADAIQQAGG